MVSLLAMAALVGITASCRGAELAAERHPPAGTSKTGAAAAQTASATPAGSRPASGAERGAGAATTAASAGAGGLASTRSGASGSTPPCTLPVLASGAGRLRSISADLDRDGAVDTVTSYAIGPRPGAGDWHLRVSFAAGGGSDAAVAEDPSPGEVRVLGAVLVGPGTEAGGEPARPVLFALMGSGASAQTVGLFRVVGCDLVPMVHRSGGRVAFVVGASFGHQEGLRCETTEEGPTLVEVTSVAHPVSGFDVTRQIYDREGEHLVVRGAAKVVTEPNAPAEAGRIVDCGAINLNG